MSRLGCGNGIYTEVNTRENSKEIKRDKSEPDRQMYGKYERRRKHENATEPTQDSAGMKRKPVR
jgi:hypothetical protein